MPEVLKTQTGRLKMNQLGKEEYSKEANMAFQEMMKDLLFGANGFCKDAPEEGKAAALEIIDNTELAKLDK